MANYIGIDFGMQNLKVCYFDGRKNIRVDLEGNQKNSSKTSRNAVYYCEDEEDATILKKYFFGAKQAEEARKYGDSDYVRYIKRELQREHYTRSVCSGRYTFSAMQIITDIFSQIYLKMNESRYDMTAPVILTVPVVFSEAQKQMLQKCAEKAGFQVKEVITEPFAALFSDDIFDECVDAVDDEEYILIFDFGASTLDICLMRIENEDDDFTIETISSTGLSFGGKDISDAIADFLDSRYESIFEKEIKAGRLDDESKKATLFEYAEELKNELYEEEDTPEAERRLYGDKIVLKRTNVDKILDDMQIWNQISSAISEMFDLTDEFDSDDYDIVSKVVMVGGTSRIQYFRDKIESLFEEAELIGGDPEEENTVYCCVSSGAVNYAKQENITVRNSIPMHVGIEVGKGFEKALNRNSFYNIPGKRKQISISQLESSKWRIKVYQTLKSVREHTDVNQKEILYAGYLQLNKDLYPKDEEVVIQLKFTTAGIVASTSSMQEIKQVIEEPIFLTAEVQYE